MWLNDWLQSRRQERLRRERDHFVSQLQKFLAGAEGDYDWDDFESIPRKDPELEAMRQSILRCGLPPMSPAQESASKDHMWRYLERLKSR
jgi:hypothetical protein